VFDRSAAQKVSYGLVQQEYHTTDGVHNKQHFTVKPIVDKKSDIMLPLQRLSLSRSIIDAQILFDAVFI